MPSLCLDTRLIWFAHCPKAGGTSVEALMVRIWGDRVGHLHWGWDLWWRRGGWRLADPPNSPQHLIWADALAELQGSPDAVFALVRDPATRLMSEYRYQRRHRRGTWAGRALAWLPFPLWLCLMLAVVRQNPHAFDNHLRPQSDFIPEDAAVFCLEDGLQPALDWLSEATGQPGLTAPDRKLSTGPGPAPGPVALARIGAAYARDYERFGYARPEARPIARGWLERGAAAFAPLVVVLDRRGLL